MRDRRGAVELLVVAGWLVGTGCAIEPRVELRTGTDTAGVERYAGPAIDVGFALRSTTTGEPVSDGLTLTLHATVHAPVVDGIQLQATDVQWVGHRVVASYNHRGPVDVGAIQVIEASHPDAPEIVAEAIFARADMNRVALRGSRLVVAGADQDLGATLERFTLDGTDLTYDDFTPLGSYAATYVDVDAAGTALVAHGSNGGATRFDLDAEPAKSLGAVAIPDARWIGSDGHDVIVVAGSPARIERHQGGLGGRVTSREIAGASVGAPTWALLQHGVLFVASDEAGVLAFDAGTLAPLGAIPVAGDGNGLALTSDRRLLFIAGGQAGLVATDVADPGAPEILASIDVPDGGSANAVAIVEHQLALADGLGGVKLLTFDRDCSAPVGDRDADGVLDARDRDDDADGVLDVDDLAPADPDAVCGPAQVAAEAGAVADVFALDCDRVDVGGPAGQLAPGSSPADHDWYDPSRRVRTVGAAAIGALDPSSHAVAPGRCGEAYVATRWRTTAIAAAGDHRLRLASTDDSWLYVDGALAVDLGGAHDLAAGERTLALTAGAHEIEVYSVRRRAVAPQLELSVVAGPGMVFGQRACLPSDGDADRDGIANPDDVAPLVVARVRD